MMDAKTNDQKTRSVLVRASWKAARYALQLMDYSALPNVQDVAQLISVAAAAASAAAALPGNAPVALEWRLIAAWRASGTTVGKLVALAADAYACGAAVSLTSIADEALVEMCERYVVEHRGDGLK